MLKSSLPLSVWLCIGAIFQSALIFLPLSSLTRYWRLYTTMLPVLFILAKMANALLITYGFKTNPYLAPPGCVNTGVTALIPDVNGDLPRTDESPNKNKVAVLILGVAVNHPLGSLAPHAAKMDALGQRMFKELDVLPQDETGFLGQSSFVQYNPGGRMDTYLISYWRSIEAIHNYATTPAHMDGVNWFHKGSKEGKFAHLGVMHEIFEAGESAWESIYVNFRPSLLGATTYLKKADKKGVVSGRVLDEWISPIVAAGGKLRNSRGRLGWDAYRGKR